MNYYIIFQKITVFQDIAHYTVFLGRKYLGLPRRLCRPGIKNNCKLLWLLWLIHGYFAAWFFCCMFYLFTVWLIPSVVFLLLSDAISVLLHRLWCLQVWQFDSPSCTISHLEQCIYSAVYRVAARLNPTRRITDCDKTGDQSFFSTAQNTILCAMVSPSA